MAEQVACICYITSWATLTPQGIFGYHPNTIVHVGHLRSQGLLEPPYQGGGKVYNFPEAGKPETHGPAHGDDRSRAAGGATFPERNRHPGGPQHGAPGRGSSPGEKRAGQAVTGRRRREPPRVRAARGVGAPIGGGLGSPPVVVACVVFAFVGVWLAGTSMRWWRSETAYVFFFFYFCFHLNGNQNQVWERARLGTPGRPVTRPFKKVVT